MNDLENTIQEAPVLTLDGTETTAPEKVAPKTGDIQESIPDDSMLSPEEKKQVEDFVAKIELTNSNMVMQYGVGAQKKIADFSTNTLNTVKTKDMGEVGEMLTGVVAELKDFDDDEEKKGILGFFKRSSNKLNTLRIKYEKAETNIDTICKTLEGQQITLMKDAAMLDKMYDLNRVYFKELTMYIIAGKKKLKLVREIELADLIARARQTGLQEDAQAANDLSALCDRFEKKLYDLELSRTIAIQTAPQIRMIQSNDVAMAEKIQSTVVNTIPLWKNQMVLALGLEHSRQAAEAERQVTDMTNELLKKNAATLKMATVETAKATERGIVDIETIRTTNESLISTLDEVIRIQNEGREARKNAEIELRRMEDELKQKMLQIKSENEG